MTNGYLLEDVPEAIAAAFDESDESDESEAAPYNRRRPVQVARPSTAYRGRPAPSGPQQQYVTHDQLALALRTVSTQITTNSAAIKTVESRAATLATEVTRQALAIKKESVDRKRETDRLGRELRQTREMAAILPMLSQPSSVTLGTKVDNLQPGDKVLVDKGDALTSLLPLMLLMGSVRRWHVRIGWPGSVE
jgi:hypothetical protein